MTTFTAIGGRAGVECRKAGAYLVFWSPAVGFRTGMVQQGSASVVNVSFVSASHQSRITASCRAGQPVGQVEERPLDRGAGGASPGTPP